VAHCVPCFRALYSRRRTRARQTAILVSRGSLLGIDVHACASWLAGVRLGSLKRLYVSASRASSLGAGLLQQLDPFLSAAGDAFDGVFAAHAAALGRPTRKDRRPFETRGWRKHHPLLKPLTSTGSWRSCSPTTAANCPRQTPPLPTHQHNPHHLADISYQPRLVLIADKDPGADVR